MRRISIHNVSESVLICFFIFLIYSPLIGTLVVQKSDVSKKEKRKLSSLPTLKFNKQSIEQFPFAFEKYFNDHFGFRNSLIRFNGYISSKWFKKSPTPLVCIGKKNWLFFTGDHLIEDFRGLIKLNNMQLDIFKRSLEIKKNWLAKQGIRYLFVVAPNKQSIYPEYMPNCFNKVGDQTKLDQLVTYLKNHSDVQIMDLRKSLLEAKKNELVYFPEDTHWNPKGTFIVYQKIMSKISEWFPQEKAFNYPSENIQIINSKCTLSTIASIDENFKDSSDIDWEQVDLDWDPSFRIKDPCAKELRFFNDTTTKSNFEKNFQPFAKGCKKSNLRAIVIRDSMFTDVEPFLSEHFKTVVYIWRVPPWNITTDQMILQLIQYIQPDIIIEEKVERILFEDV